MRVMCDKCKTSKKNIRALIAQKSNSQDPASSLPGWDVYRNGIDWRAERGTFPKLSTFLSQLKGFCQPQNIKKLKEGKIFIFGKNLSAEKN